MIVDRNNYHIDRFHESPLIQGSGKSKGIDRKRHLFQAFPFAKLKGHVMEFGVYRGKTISHIATHWPNQPIWGFDSFEGLPEPWFTNSHEHASHGAGHFDIRKEEQKPEYPANAQLIKGWFEDTIPPWLDQNPGAISFLHIDCDLYSSTRTILDLLNNRIVPGTVIVFDEMYPWPLSTPYALWAEGEYRALGEWVSLRDRAFEPLLHSGHQQCSLRIVR